MKRILIIGCPGTGKSTLARALATVTNLPLYHLDLIWHKSDRSTITRAELCERLAAILPTEEWIIDGNYAATLDLRLKYADTVILLDMPTEVALDGARERLGKARDDIPWQENELDAEFEKKILNFKEQTLPGMYECLRHFEGQLTVLHSRDEINMFLKGLGG
jgi:adenylate kinase family enzyme